MRAIFRLTDGLREAYQVNGFLVTWGMWTHQECGDLIDAAETFPQWRDATYAPLMQPHREHPAFLEALRNPQIVSIVEELVGGPVSGLQTTWYYGAPGTPGFNAHQDNYYVEAPPDAFVSVWCPMQDVTKEMGCLVGYPGTHKEPLLSHLHFRGKEDVRQDRNGTEMMAAVPEGYQGLALPLPIGSALFMHSHFLHRSGPNLSNQFRRALLLTYIRKGERFRPGNTAKREEVEVYV